MSARSADSVHTWAEHGVVKLSPKQRLFVAEYLVDHNATQAAVRAGYSAKTANKCGPRLLVNAGVAEALAAALDRQEKRLELTADKVLQGLARVAFFDLADAYDEDNKLKPIADMPREVRDAVAGVEVHHDVAIDDEEEPGQTVKLKLSSRLEALVALGKHFKLFTEKHEHSADGELADLLREARTRAQRR